jgi:hypothetical protein
MHGFYLKHGAAGKLLLRFRHFRHPWRSAEKLLLRFPHSRHPWRSHFTRRRNMRKSARE